MYFYEMREDFFTKLYIVLISIVGFINIETVIDIVGAQWYYLSVVNSIGLSYVFATKILRKNFDVSSFFKNPQNTFYFLFFLFCVISITTSINLSVSLIAISKIFISLSSLIILSQLKPFKNSTEFITILFTIYLVFEVYLSLKGYFDISAVTEFKKSMAEIYMRGATGNKNITAASIAFKIPFAYLLVRKYTNIFTRGFLLFLLTASFFNLFLLSSRAIFVSYSCTLLFLFFGNLIISLKIKKSKKHFLKTLIVFISPIIISFWISNSLLTDDAVLLSSRISSISTEDTSTASRLRYYEKGVRYFLKNPIFGSGIGNWKLISIKIDSDQINSYIIPYVAHNDFIEVLTEIGFFGGVFYLLFVLIILYYLIKLFFREKEFEGKQNILLLTIPFIIYFFDANLNFPQYRPIMQMSFLIYSFLVCNLYFKRNVL